MFAKSRKKKMVITWNEETGADEPADVHSVSSNRATAYQGRMSLCKHSPASTGLDAERRTPRAHETRVHAIGVGNENASADAMTDNDLTAFTAWSSFPPPPENPLLALFHCFASVSRPPPVLLAHPYLPVSHLRVHGNSIVDDDGKFLYDYFIILFVFRTTFCLESLGKICSFFTSFDWYRFVFTK